MPQVTPATAAPSVKRLAQARHSTAAVGDRRKARRTNIRAVMWVAMTPSQSAAAQGFITPSKTNRAEMQTPASRVAYMPSAVA